MKTRYSFIGKNILLFYLKDLKLVLQATKTTTAKIPFSCSFLTYICPLCKMSYFKGISNEKQKQIKRTQRKLKTKILVKRMRILVN